MRSQKPAALMAGLLVAGCSANPSALNPAGPAARAIAELTWQLAASCVIIFLMVVAVLLIAVSHGRRGATDQEPVPRPQPGAQRWPTRIVTGALIATFVILSIFVGVSYATDRRLLALERDAAVNVRLTAHQWWWEIRYDDPVAAKSFTTANELHLPVGQRVKIDLASQDVIHSVWLPNINGKRDVITGHDNEIWLTVAEPGEWHGRCAEFCGYQHAHMDLLVIAEPQAEFDRWRAEQAGPASSPGTDDEQRGEQVFNESACVLCHVIRGSPATGYSATAPDLTHLKSRRTLAAGTLPNSKGHLGGWIADPQGLKPGVRMPVNALPPDQFQALLAYLEILR